jgi:hypothetical protein
MKTALIYCGAARTISQTYENHAWHLRHFPSPDIFVSVCDDPQADDMLLLKEAMPHAGWHMEKVVQPPVDLPVEKTLFHSGYPRSTSPEGVLKQLWAWNRAWEFFCSVAKPEDYDVFVRIRPDTAFLRLEVNLQRHIRTVFAPNPLPAPDLKDLEAYINHREELPVGTTFTEGTCLTPWWSRWGGCNDRFAILGRLAAKAYFTTWQKWPGLRDQGAPCHPEQLLKLSMEMDGITPNDTLKVEFITVRMISPENPNGGYYPVDASVIDIADYAKSRA